MREMLFHGKSLYDNEWIEGFYVHANEAYGENIDRHFIIKHGEFEYDNYDAWEVIPETVGQYTGLCDKNGKKMFEGDVFIEMQKELSVRIPRVIEWDKVNLQFKCYYVRADWAIGRNYVPLSLVHRLACGDVEVIGNIHDNPELLEVEDV